MPGKRGVDKEILVNFGEAKRTEGDCWSKKKKVAKKRNKNEF